MPQTAHSRPLGLMKKMQTLQKARGDWKAQFFSLQYGTKSITNTPAKKLSWVIPERSSCDAPKKLPGIPEAPPNPCDEPPQPNRGATFRPYDLR